MQFDKGVIKRESLEVMVSAYKTAVLEINQAFSLLDTAGQRLRSAFGENSSRFDLVFQMKYKDNPEALKAHIKKDIWRSILDRIEVKKFMSNADLNKLEESLRDIKSIPEIEIDTITEIITGMMNTAPDYAKKMAIEAFNILTPGRLAHDKYKTNKAYARRALGSKVILTWAWVEPYYHYGTYHVNYSRENELYCIDKVFHALDGKGIPKGYRTPLVEAINQTSVQMGVGETDYYKFKCFRNGNLHLYFKRMDLVNKLNQVAGDGANIGD
jgi:hypothetical protein